MVVVSAAAKARRADHYRDPVPTRAFGKPSPLRAGVIRGNFGARMAREAPIPSDRAAMAALHGKFPRLWAACRLHASRQAGDREPQLSLGEGEPRAR
jgi:hypothetical protein